MPTIARWAPTRSDLDAATARTSAAIEASAAPADIQRAAELEEAVYAEYLRRPGGDAELQADAEAEMEAGA